MSRESKRLERIARKKDYRETRGSRILRSSTMSIERQVDRVGKQMDAMPGRPEEKYVVVLRCAGNSFYTYPIYGCPEGFTAALKDAIEKQQEQKRAAIEGGVVQGIGDAFYEPPEYLVQMMALGVNVVVTNRVQNRLTKKSDLRGSIGQGGGTN